MCKTPAVNFRASQAVQRVQQFGISRYTGHVGNHQESRVTSPARRDSSFKKCLQHFTIYFHYSGTFNRLTGPKLGNNGDQPECSFTAFENVNLYNLTGKQLGSFF